MRLLPKLTAVAVIVVALAVLVAGMVMVPTTEEQIQMLALFVVIAAAAVGGVEVLRRWAGASLLRRAVVTAAGAPLFAVTAIAVGAIAMFVSAHDLTFVLVLIGLTGALTAVMAYTLTEPLAKKLIAIQEITRQLADPDPAHPVQGGDDDIDHLRAAFDAMTTQLGQAEQASHQAEAERALLIASLTHDVRTPVTAARAAAEALRDGMSPDPARYLDSILHDLDAVSALIDDLSLLGKLESGRLFGEVQSYYLGLDRQMVDLAAIVAGASQSLAPVAACRQIEIAVESPDQVNTIGSAPEIGRVVRNLLDNAIRHSPVGTQIAVSIENSGGVPTVTIADEGPGFSADFASEAFVPFRRADPARDRARGGAGLGLAVARAIVSAHSGDIWIEPGPGGRVRFSLPALESSALEASGLE